MRRKIKELIESARRNKTVDAEWISETCYLLQKSKRADEEVRAKVLATVEEVEEEFRQKAERWRSEGFDYLEELWPLYERLLAAVEPLAERPDREAAQRLCQTLREIWLKAEEIAVKNLFGL